MSDHSREKDDRLIDRYLQGAVSGIEQQEFRDRLDKDSAFRERFEFRKLLIAGISLAADESIRKEIIAAIGYRRSGIPFGLRLLFVFLLVLISVLFAWNYLGNEQGGEKPVLSFRWLNKVGEIIHLKKSEPSSLAATTSDTAAAGMVDPENQSPDSVSTAGEVIGIDTTAHDGLEPAEEADIVVRKDQLLLTLNLTPQVVGGANGSTVAPTGSLAESAAKKMNPQAGLVVPADKDGEFPVEFWESPVNYHGYRWDNNTLMLYGIDQPDKVRLYRLDRRLFLRSGTELFEIVPAADFMPYRPLKDPEILSQCR